MMNADKARPPEQPISDVGPIYGVRAYLKRVQSAFEAAGESFQAWFDAHAPATKKGINKARMCAIVDDYQQQLAEQICFDISVTWHSKLGKPAVTVTSYSGEAMTLETMQGEQLDQLYWEDAIFVRRTELTITEKRLEYHDSPAHFAINRHGLERLYERENCTLATFDGIVAAAIMKTLDCMSIAALADVTAVTTKRQMALPFCDGIVIADGRMMVDVSRFHEDTSFRVVANKGLVRSTEPFFNKMLTLQSCHENRTVVSTLVYVTRTYLDETRLSDNRAHYLRLFQKLHTCFDASKTREGFLAPTAAHALPKLSKDWPDSAIGLLVRLKDRLDNGIITANHDPCAFICRPLGNRGEKPAAK